MRISSLLLVLFSTILTPSLAAGIDELLGKASAVVEGAVVNGRASGSVTTIEIAVISVLLGSIRPGDTIAVECNGLQNAVNRPYPQPYAYAKILFLQTTKLGGWACVPVEMRGYSYLGYLGYPQAPPCAEGDLQLLGPKSVRERILTRVAESALCGARHLWPVVLDASSPGRTPLGSLEKGSLLGKGPLSDAIDFDRRVFRELVRSPRRDLHMEAIQALIQLGDPLPFDLLVRNHKEYQNNKQEWWTIGATIERTLINPSIIPQLATLLPIQDAALQLATATALQRFHTPAAVVLLGKYWRRRTSKSRWR